MKKLLKILAGLIVSAGTFLLTYSEMPMESWGNAAIELIKGGATIVFFLIGLILIGIGFNDLKN
jgi:hypothetical protein